MKSVLVLTIAVVAVATATPTYKVHRGTKVIDGEDASIDDFPHFLQLEIDGQLYGAASIYNAHTAITSAYIVSRREAADVRLRSGSDQRGSNGTLHQAVNITIHPKYVWPGEDFDVALVIVDEPFDARNVISLVSTPPPAGALLSVTGMGDTTGNGTISATLQTKTVKLVDHEECKQDLDGLIVSNNMICAELSAWYADFGAPLEYQGQLAGTFSNGFVSTPGIYANIARLRTWIQNNAV